MENIAPVSEHREINRTLRLTFQINREVQLVSQERLDMICPPFTGNRPQAGVNGGFWVELRDKREKALFHRVVNNPLGNSVEVHSPDGKIQREFGDARVNIFEVLVPDYDQAATIALFGESLEPDLKAQEKMASRELANFKVTHGIKGYS